MNELFGIDPAAPENDLDIRHLIYHFGPSQGRFIANFPMEWKHDLRDNLGSRSDLSKKMAEEALINRLDHALLPIKTQFNSKLPWHENAQNLSKCEEISRLIGPAGRCNNTVYPIDKVWTDLDAFFPPCHGNLLELTPEAYVKAALPILLVSRKVVLIDPYFALHKKPYHSKPDKNAELEPDKGKIELLSMFLDAAVKGNQVEAFEIFYSPMGTKFEIEKQKEALSLVKKEVYSNKEVDSNKQITVTVHSLDVDGRQTKQHDRFLLGLKSGLSFGHGFLVSKNKKKHLVSWVIEPVLTSLLEEFT